MSSWHPKFIYQCKSLHYVCRTEWGMNTILNKMFYYGWMGSECWVGKVRLEALTCLGSSCNSQDACSNVYGCWEVEHSVSRTELSWVAQWLGWGVSRRRYRLWSGGREEATWRHPPVRAEFWVRSLSSVGAQLIAEAIRESKCDYREIYLRRAGTQ